MTKMTNINLRISQDILDEYTKQAKKRTQELGKKNLVQKIILEFWINSIHKNKKNSQENFQKDLMEKTYILAKMNSK